MTIQNASVLGYAAIGGADPNFDGSTAAINALDIDTKLALTAWLGSYIRDNQDQFTAGQVSTARTMTGLSGQPLADAGFSVSDFLTETASNADTLIGAPLVNLGNTVSQVATLLPLVLVGAGLLILYSWTKTAAAK